jgi:hypothetical protein
MNFHSILFSPNNIICLAKNSQLYVSRPANNMIALCSIIISCCRWYIVPSPTSKTFDKYVFTVWWLENTHHPLPRIKKNVLICGCQRDEIIIFPFWMLSSFATLLGKFSMNVFCIFKIWYEPESAKKTIS